MELIELEEERQLIREEAAAWLHELADALARNNELRFRRSGKTFTVKVPRDVSMEVEVEIEADASSIEIEISW